MTGIRKAFPNFPLQGKRVYKNSKCLHLWYTLMSFSLSLTMREADGNSFNCAYRYCPQMLSYCLKNMKNINK